MYTPYYTRYRTYKTTLLVCKIIKITRDCEKYLARPRESKKNHIGGGGGGGG